ncbi:MAG: hypothetical protein WCT42_01250 [Candidatus Paceibacterota bacterium]
MLVWQHMDIKELDKKQLILLVLLITFVVSIATGIVTVSLMNQMPKNVPQTINNVIQRTIEKVTTVEAPVTSGDVDKNNNTNESVSSFGNSDALVSIYLNKKEVVSNNTNTESITTTETNPEIPAVGQGVIISDLGLILVDSSLVNELESYKVILNKITFDASILKKFNNGFTVLKISPIKETTTETTKNTDTTIKTQ